MANEKPNGMKPKGATTGKMLGGYPHTCLAISPPKTSRIAEEYAAGSNRRAGFTHALCPANHILVKPRIARANLSVASGAGKIQRIRKRKIPGNKARAMLPIRRGEIFTARVVIISSLRARP
jgi:hypothetical protein